MTEAVVVVIIAIRQTRGVVGFEECPHERWPLMSRRPKSVGGSGFIPCFLRFALLVTDTYRYQRIL